METLSDTYARLHTSFAHPFSLTTDNTTMNTTFPNQSRKRNVTPLCEDGAEARNRPHTPRTNPTKSLLVGRGERRVTSEPVLTLELLLEVADRTPFPTHEANYEYERPGRVNLRNSLKPVPNILS